MDRILISLKKENGPRASSAPALGLNTIRFKHVYWYMQQTQVSVYRTIGPLVCGCIGQSVLDLVGNPEDQFSCIMVQLKLGNIWEKGMKDNFIILKFKLIKVLNALVPF